ncbi:MAG: metallophosphoesterase family protein [Candidatus Omnitrophota bacterium]|nr:metallophosphoesterase family protein [Candidatus Omnitrophota bacterium]
MRYAIISDVHGNLEAFESVLNALSEERIDSYLFVGDVVGYGANPKECVKLLKSLSPIVSVAGNHEWGVLGKTELSYFNEFAQAAILWTKKSVSSDEIEYFKSLPLVYEDEKMTLVHGTLNMPEEFYYIIDTEDAYVALSQLKSPLCFVGHSHVPAIFASDHTKVECIERMDIKIDSERKYIINAGSIGQPRDGDPRASFAVYDDEESTVEIKRVEYDIKKAQDKILKAGMPPNLAYRLSEGR